MLLLTGTSDLIQLVTASSVIIDAHSSWVDVSGSTVTPGRTNTVQIGTNATTTIVGSPGGSTQRNVKFLSIRNAHATSSNLITVQHFDGTTTTTLIKFTLLAGYSLNYNDGTGWILVDASGGQVVTPLVGRYLGTSVLTSASANFTTQAATNTIVIRGVAGGGGGGGCTSVSSAAAGGGGGSAGGYAEKTFTVTPNTAYAYTCGALGAGGISLIGTAGTDSTFVVGATTVTCKGGIGGPVGTAVTTLSAYPGAAAPAVSTNGDTNSSGAPGGPGIVVVVATPLGVGGAGGSGPFGAGGNGIAAVGTGTAGTGHGSGGGGALTGATAGRTGGAGTAGMWIVDEYS